MLVAQLFTGLLALGSVHTSRGMVERDGRGAVLGFWDEFSSTPLHTEVGETGWASSAPSAPSASSAASSSSSSQSTCDTCRQVVLDLEDRLNDPQLQDGVVDFLLENVCPMLPEDASRTCKQEARVVVAQIAASIQQMIDVDGICVGVGACPESRPREEANELFNNNDDGPLSSSTLTSWSSSSSSSSSVDLSSPWYCHGLDCPYFTVLEKSEGYEKRRYVGGTWASTTVEAYLYAMASARGFKRLFEYIDEGNALGVKIPMTSPVRVRVEPSCGAFCKQNFTVSFFMPKEYQSHPPPPLDDTVFIEKDPPATYYVKSSGGFKVDDISVAHMANSLAQELDAAGKSYDGKAWFVAGYDPPFRLSDRHNEVWFTAGGEQQQAEIPSNLAGEDDACDICENVVEEVTEAVEDPETQAEAIAYAKAGCAALGGSLESACDQMVDEFGPLLIAGLVEALVGGDDVCRQMGYC